MDLRLELKRVLFSVQGRLCSWRERERERERDRQTDRQTDGAQTFTLKSVHQLRTLGPACCVIPSNGS